MLRNCTIKLTSAMGVVAALSFTGAAILCDAVVLVHGASAQQQPDHTEANKQMATTADQQKDDAADRELAQKIRQSMNSQTRQALTK